MKPRHLVQIPDEDVVEAVLSNVGLNKPDPGLLVSSFARASTRTRLAVDIAAAGLGLRHLEIPWDRFYANPAVHGASPGNLRAEMHSLAALGVRACLIRVLSQAMLNQLAEVSPIPVVSGCSDAWHPIQALTDRRVLDARFPRGACVAFLGNGRGPVVSSLIAILARSRHRLAVIGPASHLPRLDLLKRTPGVVATAELEALADADVVYTDEWWYRSATEQERMLFAPYRLTPALLHQHQIDPFIMHCLPHDEEIDPDLLFGDRSLVWAQVAEKPVAMARAIAFLAAG